MVLGAMIAFDMGGPVNKAAFFFGAAMIKESNYAVMGACAAAICTPPLGLGLATLLGPQRWTRGEREAGLAGAGHGPHRHHRRARFPFAAADPLRVIPPSCSARWSPSIVAMLGGVGDHAPHGGPIVLPVVDHRIDVCRLPSSAGSRRSPALTINLVKATHRERRGRCRGSARQTSMKIVAVTACPTGIAHTYMAAEQLEKTAKKLGHDIKVETQGAMGIENELSTADIAAPMS